MRRAVPGVGFVVILLAGVIGWAGPVGARPGAANEGPRDSILTNHSKVEAFAIDNSASSDADIDTEEASDVSSFSAAVAAEDVGTDPARPGRLAQAAASQDTTLDDSNPPVTTVDSLGETSALWTDGEADDGTDPVAHATSEFSITFEVTDGPTFFAVSGDLSAEADDTSLECTTITVTSPSGATFDVAAPAGCGAPPNLSIVDAGKLQPGTHTFSVIANAQVTNPSALGGDADAVFDVSLNLGCSIVGTPDAETLSGTTGDDFICGLGGEDTIDGLGGDDTIYGGRGNNLITGGDDNDVIIGDEDADTIIAGDGNDRILDIGGSNIIEGGTGNDVIYLSGDRDDLIFGDDSQGCDGALSDPGLDDDDIFGGGGNDHIFGCQGLDTILGGGGDDEIFGNTGHDDLRGGTGSDKIHGNDGPDTIFGGTRKDVLFGDGDNDKLFANDGVFDVVHGGSGGGDEAKIDENVDQVDGVEVFL